tara:strand:- start:615 stop:1457 length:843 start_codon:yes stop_codon:yes gene_type:complete
MTSVVFIADFFVEHILGGGEINNEEFIDILSLQGYKVHKFQSHLVNQQIINNFKDSVFVVANFTHLGQQIKSALADKKYVIYEHDHKYLKSRNPAAYPQFKAPQDEIINKQFYKSASAVLCQSTFHKNIVYKNLQIDNIVSLGGNLWSVDDLSLLREMSNTKKVDRCSIMQSSIPHKNTTDSIRYCKAKSLEYELIPSLPYRDFLRRLGNNESLVFFPKTPETLSRIIVEARMMGMMVITNNLVGASKEEWFKLRGEDLIEVMAQKRRDIPNIIKETLGL